MRKLNLELELPDWIALILLGLLAALYFWNLGAVPFHPDEATQIYLSKDIQTLFSQPLDLAWDGDSTLSDQERIRAIDAPLAKYAIGAARGLLSIPPLAADWDWSASWEENAADGALPASQQLQISRVAITLAALAGLWFFYLAVKKILPGPLAALALVLLGLNPLILLHARRAMSEGILLFCLAFFLWAAARERRSPWLIGLALGLAVNAKHTAAALLPAGLYAVSLIPKGESSLKKTGVRVFQFLLAAGLVTAALNPFYWKQPFQALQVGLRARSVLAAQQWADHEQALGLEDAGPLVRGAATLAQVYFTPPQTEEVGNYLEETRETSAEYLANPLHRWGRSWVVGGIYLVLSLMGFILALREIWHGPPGTGDPLTWVLASLGIYLVLLLPLPWQRYSLPLLPFAAAWAVKSLVPMYQKIRGDSDSTAAL